MLDSGDHLRREFKTGNNFAGNALDGIGHARSRIAVKLCQQTNDFAFALARAVEKLNQAFRVVDAEPLYSGIKSCGKFVILVSVF